jgi:hypothetical protein
MSLLLRKYMDIHPHTYLHVWKTWGGIYMEDNSTPEHGDEGTAEDAKICLGVLAEEVHPHQSV